MHKLLNVGGDKVNPEIVEEVIATFPAIADCAVVTVANELGIEEIQALIVPRGVFDEDACASIAPRSCHGSLCPCASLPSTKFHATISPRSSVDD
jgi:acyl-CoA synthetase (AMP-forming)/AMP-acid ligase II